MFLKLVSIPAIGNPIVFLSNGKQCCVRVQKTAVKGTSIITLEVVNMCTKTIGKYVYLI